MKHLKVTALLCLLFVSTSRAQEPVASPMPSGRVVKLSLIATDKDNKGVSTIAKDQLRVFEEGTEQTILSIEPDERPVDLVLAMDCSASLNRLMKSAIDGARLVVLNRRPVDQIAVVRFISSDKIEKTHEFTNDGDAILKALDDLYLEAGQSAVIDAAYVSAEYVTEYNKDNEARRKVVVLITDGEDRLSYYKESALVKLLREQGVQVFVLGLVIDLDRQTGYISKSSREKAEKLLTTLAEESGGRVFFPSTKEKLVIAMAEIILDLRAQFRVNYQSTNSNSKTGFRKVEVKFVSTDGEKRKLIVPRGYYFGPRPSATTSEKKKR
jgi:Ca-activated chloride channel homolog